MVVALILLLVAVVILHLRLAYKYQKLREERENNWQAQLKNAQLKARKVIEDANTQASQIVGSAQGFKREQIDMLNSEIYKAVETYTDTYNQVMINLQNEIVKVLGNTPEDIKNGVIKELEVIRNALQKDLIESRKKASAVIEKEYSKLQSDIESYKLTRLKQLDNSIFQIIEMVSKKVLAKEISAEEHEKLVIKALEEAKRQEMLEVKSQTPETNSETQPIKT
jgi:F0F1-type ATP synthase membrane subunit b/b'